MKSARARAAMCHHCDCEPLADERDAVAVQIRRLTRRARRRCIDYSAALPRVPRKAGGDGGARGRRPGVVRDEPRERGP